MRTDVIVQLVAKRLLACPLDRHLLQHLRLVVQELLRCHRNKIYLRYARHFRRFLIGDCHREQLCQQRAKHRWVLSRDRAQVIDAALGLKSAEDSLLQCARDLIGRSLPTAALGHSIGAIHGDIGRLLSFKSSPMIEVAVRGICFR